MIVLTRLNSKPLMVNSDLIKFVEQSPDTVITLLNGEKLLVRESAEEVRNLIAQFRRSLLAGLFPVRDYLAVPPSPGEHPTPPPEKNPEG